MHIMAHSKITDDDMRYYQFRARQRILLQQEDHEWNEFCRSTKCTCCSCQSKSIKEVGIQTTFLRKKQNITHGMKVPNPPTTKNQEFSTLDEIKDQLQSLNMKLSNVILMNNEASQNLNSTGTFRPKRINAEKQEKTAQNSILGESLTDEDNEKRMQWIQASLRSSLSRLQSASVAKNIKPALTTVNKKYSGYILPQELVRQRNQARKAYLASLAKNSELTRTSHTLKNKNIIKTKKAVQRPNTSAKSKLSTKKVSVKVKRKESEEISSVSEAEPKDEHITKAVDGIIDDLLGEIVVLVERKKILRKEETKKNLDNRKIPEIPKTKPDKQLYAMPLRFDSTAAMSNWEKVRKNISHIKNEHEQQLKFPAQDENAIENLSCTINDSHSISTTTINEVKSRSEVATPKLKKLEITVDSKVLEEARTYRRTFDKYLHRISRSEKGQFNPVLLSNMVAESILDDCLSDVSKEFNDVPLSLVTDLYKKEFLQSL